MSFFNIWKKKFIQIATFLHTKFWQKIILNLSKLHFLMGVSKVAKNIIDKNMFFALHFIFYFITKDLLPPYGSNNLRARDDRQISNS